MKYTRKSCSEGCSGSGEVALMDVTPAGVRIRGRATAAAEEAADNSGSAKRMKVVGDGELMLCSSNSVRISGSDCENVDVIATLNNYVDSGVEELRDLSGDASSGDAPPASCCSSNGSVTENLKSADLEETIEVETTMRSKLNGRESTPTSELKEESGELESPNISKSPVNIKSRREIPPEKTPPAAELEEFFAKAEENLHKCFKDKYNYDIVNDVPLKGRFEWIQLNP